MKAWKSKPGANVKVGGYDRTNCNCMTCDEYKPVFNECGSGKNFRSCGKYHVRKKDSLL